jgi:hypothetical protein
MLTAAEPALARVATRYPAGFLRRAQVSLQPRRRRRAARVRCHLHGTGGAGDPYGECVCYPAPLCKR